MDTHSILYSILRTHLGQHTYGTNNSSSVQSSVSRLGCIRSLGKLRGGPDAARLGGFPPQKRPQKFTRRPGAPTATSWVSRSRISSMRKLLATERKRALAGDADKRARRRADKDHRRRSVGGWDVHCAGCPLGGVRSQEHGTKWSMNNQMHTDQSPHSGPSRALQFRTTPPQTSAPG